MEMWKDIPGYDGIYQASTDGRIRTCEGKTTSNARYPVRRWKQRYLKPKNDGCRGDLRVSLWKCGHEKTWLVARLVGLTWCDGYSEGLTINHINGNPLDNRAENLEWVTRSENIKKGFKSGLYASVQHPVCVESDGIYMTFESKAKASLFLGRNHGYVSNCLRTNKKAVSTDGKHYTVKEVRRE